MHALNIHYVLTVKERPEVFVVSFHQLLDGRRKNLSLFHLGTEQRVFQKPAGEKRRNMNEEKESFHQTLSHILCTFTSSLFQGRSLMDDFVSAAHTDKTECSENPEQL